MKFVCREWLVEDLVKLNVNKKNIYVLKDRKTYDLGKLTIKPIETYHDVENTSYLVDFKPITMYYATDTRELPNDECLRGLNYYFIEANYNEELMQEHIQGCLDNGDSENKLFYLQRAMNNHLSSKKTYDFLIENMKNDSKYILLHKSNYNYIEEK